MIKRILKYMLMFGIDLTVSAITSFIIIYYINGREIGRTDIIIAIVIGLGTVTGMCIVTGFKQLWNHIRIQKEERDK